MGIYRGAGGTGDAIADSSSEALLVRNLAIEAQADADAAAASAAAAAASASTASTAASNAQTAETNAETAEANAETAQAAAEAAQSAAETAETNAETAQAAAATSATNAANSASSASTSASNAASSASTASTQATNASNSASAAATSATNASNSASAAATSATNAASSATAAAGSATAASNSASSAASSESNAASSASSASTSAGTATTQAGIATTQATNAASSASAASTSATNASNSASAASTSASNASTSETNAGNSATAAASSATSAAASYDSFDDRYLGPKSSAPSVDNDGNTLLVGALYFNTADNAMKVWNGASWLDAYASLSGALLATNNLSDLTSASTARTNLGLGTAATTASTDYATAAQGTKADNALTAANPSYTGTLTGGTGVVNLGSGQFYKDASGNVGIGTTAPSQLLELSSASNPCVMMTDTTNTVKSYMFAGNLAAYMGSATNHPTVFQVNDSEKMRIDTSGNVGIGVTPPAWASGFKALQVNDASVWSTSGDASLTANSYYNGSNYIYIKSNAASRVYHNTDGSIAWFQAPSGTAGATATFTERMRIDSSGNLLVGTTSQIGSGFVNIKFNSGPNNGITMQDTATSGWGQYIYFINSSSAQAGLIGHTGSTTVAYTTSSDYRLKEDVASITNALDKVSALKPVTYKWKEDGSAGEGFIAHELAEVCPQAVIGEKDAVNQDGSIKAQSIDTSFLVATLTAAIQELKAELDATKAEVAALKAK